MKIAIIGPPQSGKTAIFKILLNNKDISWHIGIFKPKDARLEKLSDMFSSQKKTYPEFTFVDKGVISNLSKQDISVLQDVDLFICVIGAFFSEAPKRDFEGVITDMIISDLELVQNRIARIEKDAGKTNNGQEKKILEKCQALLSEEKFLYKNLDSEEVKQLSGIVLLTARPMILAINIAEDMAPGLEDKIKELEDYSGSKPIKSIRFFGKAEFELLDIEPDEREKFLKELGAGYNFTEDISTLIFNEMGLITFFTAGEKETRSWHLRSGLNALSAAGKIHSDIERGFIRAEVMSFNDLIKYGSEAKVKAMGLLKVEGKEYIVRDGDIINVRFSV